jgi:alpha-galactosidase
MYRQRTYRTEGKSCMRTLKAAGLAALASGAIGLLGSLPAHAAVLSVGSSNSTFGGIVCGDVQGGSLDSFTPVQAWNCNAAPNQQFEFNGTTIYTVGAQRCLDVYYAGTAPGTIVESFPCNGTGAQTWYYFNGELVNLNSGLCLDATNMADGTQLVINWCNGADSQNWQIK